MNRKTKKIVFLSSLVSTLLVGISYAYFSDQDKRFSVLALGDLSGHLFENTNEENVEIDESGIVYLDKLYPGDIISKEPFIKLDSDSISSYVRVKIDITSDTLSDEDLSKIKLDINHDEGWYEGDDGYIYYSEELNSNHLTSSNIFNHVTIDKTMSNEFARSEVVIKITGELRQSQGFNPTYSNGHIVSW